MKKFSWFLAMLLVILAGITSCKHEPIFDGLDAALYEEAVASGYTDYQNGTLLNPAAPSPHGAFKLRFNAIAQAVLDSSGELPVGNTFPAGSILVKELYTGNTLSQYAVMKKAPTQANSANGWVWAEFAPGGAVTFSSGKKGNGCTGCHSGTPNRDLVRTFDLH